MGRQPLPKRFRDPKDWIMSRGTISERPELAAIVGRCMGVWSNAELQMAILLSILLKAEGEAAVAVYLVLRRNIPRYAALNAAAAVTLVDERDKKLFDAVMLVCQQAGAERNALAHGSFGIHLKMPKSLLWLEASDATQFIIEALRQHKATGVRLPLSAHKPLADKMYHYTEKALEDVYKQLEAALNVLFHFNIYLRDPPGPTRDHEYDQLCKLAPIQKALRDLRAPGRQNKQSAPPRSRPRKPSAKQRRLAALKKAKAKK